MKKIARVFQPGRESSVADARWRHPVRSDEKRSRTNKIRETETRVCGAPSTARFWRLVCKPSVRVRGEEANPMPVQVGLTCLAARSAAELPPDEVVFGSTARMQELREKLEKVAGTHFPILLSGEIGAGKEVVSRWVHSRSPWRHSLFIKVNCPIARGAVFQHEVFGIWKEPQADGEKAGDGADGRPTGATLFLDEIAELSPSLQRQLVQLVEDARPAQNSRGPGRLRLISVTAHQLTQDVQAETFRRDLFYALNGVSFHLPPLRERREDIPALVGHFLGRCAKEYGAEARQPTAQFMDLLKQSPWPGNIRQLEDLVKRYFVLGAEEAIARELMQPGQPPLPVEQEKGRTISLKHLARETVRELERKMILKALEENHWNRKQAARALSISYRALFYKMKAADLSSARDAWRAGENGQRSRG